MGCAYTWPSTAVENSRPKSAADTADGANPGSARSHPVRRLSDEIVTMSADATHGWAASPTVATIATTRLRRTRRPPYRIVTVLLICALPQNGL